MSIKATQRVNAKEAYKKKSANWRIVIPNLQEFVGASAKEYLLFKEHILGKILKNENKGKRCLKYYRIALEHHSNGVPHLDILLVYERSVNIVMSHFDYLYKRGHITTYRQLNEAIIEYGKKEDKQNLTNFPTEATKVLRLQELKKNPYRYLEFQMLKDPLKFKLEEYVRKNDLNQYLSNWSSIKVRLRDSQVAAANLLLESKNKFKLITPAVLYKKLTKKELALYYGEWDGYRRIVQKLNQIAIYGYNRPFKTKQLLIVGPAHIGKTSLASEPKHTRELPTIEDLTSVYHMGMRHWFPKYQSEVYRMILWDEFKLTSYSYDTILKLLQGSPMDLPYHGGATKKDDNPLIYMTSNMTLEQHICHKFMREQDRALARQNLRPRIEEIIIPKGYDLFLLRRLLS